MKKILLSVALVGAGALTLVLSAPVQAAPVTPLPLTASGAATDAGVQKVDWYDYCDRHPYRCERRFEEWRERRWRWRAYREDWRRHRVWREYCWNNYDDWRCRPRHRPRYRYDY